MTTLGLLGQALAEIAESPDGPFARLLRMLVGAAGASGRATDVLFGINTRAAHFGPGPAVLSGLYDAETLVVDTGAVLSPLPGQLAFVRARTSIVWNGEWLADGVFQPNTGNLITLGSQVQSGGGGGGGGGASAAASPGNFGNYSQGGGGGGGGAGYLPPMPGNAGAGGNPGLPGQPGTQGVPGLVDPFQLATLLSEYPGVLAALFGCAPGVQGQQGGQGGQGSNGGFGGNSGQGAQNGGAAGGLLILASPSITFGPSALFRAHGLAGDPAPTTGPNAPQQGGNANSGSNGGGGGGGGGGSGAQGGTGGVVLAFYGSFTNGGATFDLPAGGGGLGAAGAAGGLPDGGGLPGAIGGAGAPGPAGALGFFHATKILP